MLTILKKIGFILVIAWFGFTLLLLSLSFTTLPFWGIHQLSKAGANYEFEPDYIIFMSGSGFPGKSSLIRIYYTGVIAQKYTGAKVIAAFPGEANDTASMLSQLQNELLLRGIDSSRLLFEPNGTNTRWQALEIKKQLIPETTANILLVSSPEHIYRSVHVFERIGFKNVGSFACFERNINVSLEYDTDQIEGNKYVPDIGGNQQLRYQFWNHLKYEIVLLREYMAITYYYLQGWI